MIYLLVKWLHVLSATLLFGTGLGSAFFVLVARRRGHLAGLHGALCTVILADWLFTTPAVLIQLGTGLYLAHGLGLAPTEGWVGLALLLYLFVGACWLPVVALQYRLRAICAAALKDGAPLPAAFTPLWRWWVALGSLAFPVMLVIFWLMVAKPG